MEIKRQEIWELTHKIDRLYVIVKQLGNRIGWEGIEDLSFNIKTSSENFELVNDFTARQQDLAINSLSQIEDKVTNSKQSKKGKKHQDILEEEEHKKRQNSHLTCDENSISCEDQVQRLTAQLTAAYHRIASLEDQLLANRTMGETRNNTLHGNH
ncbi:MAG: hypothetical protein IGQ45_05725 [Cyanobacterium sp. T60_A2020_053]|nr:hypothetical protein [Cyanobacterium sp. T60_A2020_053]